MATTLEPVALRRRAARQARRTTFRVLRLYLTGLGLRRGMSRAEVVGMRVALARWLARPMFRPDPDVVTTPVRHHLDGGQVRGEWVEAPGVAARDDAAILYVHGGGFVAGSPATHRGLTAALSVRTGLPVFSLDYRLAPEHPFPAAIDDTERVWRWLLARGLDPSRVVVMGDSAGGHLALALPPRAVRSGLPVPAGVVAFSPVIDLSMTIAAERERTTPDPVVTARSARAVVHRYHGGVDHPDLRLLDDDALAAMPPVLLQAGDDEFLADDAEHYVEALASAGGDAVVRTWPRQPHVFQIAHRTKVAREALDDVASFVARVTG